MAKDKPGAKPGFIRESPVTYDDYAAMPDDGNRYEVADGKLELMSPGPSLFHQAVSYEMQYVLNQSCRSEYVIFSAPFDVIFSKTEVRQPDLVMVHRSRMSILTKRGVEGAPDLVVEILSPHSRKRDKVHKTKVYAKYSVPEYWVVDPVIHTLEQYVLSRDHYELINLYSEDEPIHSEKIACVSFTMNDILDQVPDLHE